VRYPDCYQEADALETAGFRIEPTTGTLSATMRTFPLLATLGLWGALCVAPALAQSADPRVQPMVAEDVRFLGQMMRADVAEIATAKVALERTQTEAVRKYAQLMADAHAKLLEEGEKIAKLHGVTVRHELDPGHQDALSRLQNAPRTGFDRAYVAHVIGEHRAALELLRRAGAEARDANVKALAAKAAPHVEKHLEIAQELADGLDARSSSTR
jgi:putative membrane protein